MGVYNQEGDFLFSLDFDNYELAIYYYLDNTTTGTPQACPSPTLQPTPCRSLLISPATAGAPPLMASCWPPTSPSPPGLTLNLGDIDASWIVYSADTPATTT